MLIDWFVGMFLLYCAATLSSILAITGVLSWLSTEKRKTSMEDDDVNAPSSYVQCPVCGTDVKETPPAAGARRFAERWWRL